MNAAFDSETLLNSCTRWPPESANIWTAEAFIYFIDNLKTSNQKVVWYLIKIRLDTRITSHCTTHTICGRRVWWCYKAKGIITVLILKLLDLLPRTIK